MSSDTVKTDMNVDRAQSFESDLQEWIQFEKAAIELIRIVGSLWFDRSVELVMFRSPLFDKSASEILAMHEYVKEIAKKQVTVSDTLLIAKELFEVDLAPSRIDLGRLVTEWVSEKANFNYSASTFVSDKMANFIGRGKMVMKPKDVILYGFGRIGRLAARELISQAGKGEQLRLRAIVTRRNTDTDILKRAELLRNDSIHGPFPGTVKEDFENKVLVVNGHNIHMIAAGSPEDVDYTQYGINDALLIDNTGVARDREGLSRHLKAQGVDKVLLTAPGKGDIPNVVYGVNNNSGGEEEKIYSAASCTTNAIVPVLKVINDNLGVVNGHIETIHAFTNDQNLLDNYHSKSRRGRSAPLNMVITETGAAKAVEKVLPELAGKLSGNAVRVPTPDVSLAILHLNTEKECDIDQVNEILKMASLEGALIEQIQYSFSNETVSSDLIGNPYTSIVDGPATIVAGDKKSMVLYVWYDNEYGYTRQVIRYAKYISKVIRLTYY